MKRVVALVLVLLWAVVPQVLADSYFGDYDSRRDLGDSNSHQDLGTYKIGQKQWELIPEYSSYKYEEPSLMETSGHFTGFSLSYASALPQDWAIRCEGKYSKGSLDYSSNGTGSQKDITDIMAEIRAIVQLRMDSHKGFFHYGPYLGLGYRYLNDDSSGWPTDTGYWGYERESNYYYFPLGGEVGIKPVKTIECSLGAEYDYLLWGVQKTHLSDVPSPYYDTVLTDITNRQKKGYGYKFYLRFLVKAADLDFICEPFFKYWAIKESAEADIYLRSSDGSEYLIGSGVEPENNTREIGLRLGVRF